MEVRNTYIRPVIWPEHFVFSRSSTDLLRLRKIGTFGGLLRWFYSGYNGLMQCDNRRRYNAVRLITRSSIVDPDPRVIKGPDCNIFLIWMEFFIDPRNTANTSEGPRSMHWTFWQSVGASSSCPESQISECRCLESKRCLRISQLWSLQQSFQLWGLTRFTCSVTWSLVKLWLKVDFLTTKNVLTNCLCPGGWF